VRRIEALRAQGERACDREALATKESGRKSDGCAGKSTHPYLGRPRLMPERGDAEHRRSEESAEVVVAAPEPDRDGPRLPSPGAEAR